MNKKQIRIFFNTYYFRGYYWPLCATLESMLQEIYIKNTHYKQEYY